MEQLIAEDDDVMYNRPMIWPEIDFAALCRDLRAWKKMTQEEMADYLGVNRRSYRYWEAGTREPGAQATFRLCRILQEYESKKLRKKFEDP